VVVKAGGGRKHLLWGGEGLDQLLHRPGAVCVQCHLHQGLLLRCPLQHLHCKTQV